MAEKIQPEKIVGGMNAVGLRFGVVVSRFNSFITERLLQGAVDALERGGAAGKEVDVVHVPGSFELPLVAKKLALTGRYDAIIAIGCVLRGETAHYDYVCSETARGLQLAQMDTGVPVMFCVLTCDTLEQAIDRAGNPERKQLLRMAIESVHWMGSAKRGRSKYRFIGALAR